MDAIHEAFYDAKGNEASDVDAMQKIQVLENPVFQREALTERCVEGYEVEVGEGGFGFRVVGGGGGAEGLEIWGFEDWAC